MFTELTGNVVILNRGGVFYQATVYKSTMNNRIYAKVGQGYVRLGADGATSSPKVAWVAPLKDAPNVAVRNTFVGPEFA